jgi:hypothetical protein
MQTLKSIPTDGTCTCTKTINSRRPCQLALAFLLLCATAWAATVRNNEILYVGGTVATLPAGTKGRFALLDKDSAQFVSPAGSVAIPYKGIVRLGYGEKITRRILEAMTVSWLFIFTERHQHLVTIEFADDAGNKKVGVFEVGKDNLAAVAAVLENRSGLKFEFESQKAEADFRKQDFRPQISETRGDTK